MYRLVESRMLVLLLEAACLGERVVDYIKRCPVPTW